MSSPRVRRHDVAPQYRRFRAEIDGAVRRVLASGRYLLGDEGEAFEREFAGYVGRRFGVGVGSGTDALRLALLAGGLEPGDGVVTSTYAPTPVAAAIVAAGGRPVFADVSPTTCLIDPDRLEERIDGTTRFVVAVHLFGLPCDMPRLLALAARHDLTVVEDAAQAHGTTLAGRRAGSFASSACFSFYPTKNLGCYGDAGMVLTDRPELAERLRLLRNYGKRDDPFESHALGGNSRFDELQAAIARVKLPYLDRLNRERRQLVALYREGLAGAPVEFLAEPPEAESNCHVLTVLCDGFRDRLAEFLAARGIQTNVYYPRPLHRMAAYRPFVEEGATFPVAEATAAKALALPLYSELDRASVEGVIAAIHDFFRGARPAPMATRVAVGADSCER